MVRKATPVAAAASLFAATAFGTLAFSPPATAALDCDPGAFNTCERFSTTGDDQTWTVPTGVTSVSVEVWGAGGGGPGAGWFPAASSGGSGGYTTGTLSVYPGQQLKVVVGAPGEFGSATVTYGGGGAGGAGEGNNDGSSGGGMSAIFRGTDLLVAAGGGGGASIGSLGVPDGVAAGPGGGATGGQDTAPQSSGRGGTASAGGAAAVGYGIAMCSTEPTAGSQYQGGSGGAIPAGPVNSEGGGGGGGGYFGGGGGSCQDNAEVGKQNGPGGGGSGFVGGAGVSNATTTAGTPSGGNGQVAQPAGLTSPNYVSGIGVGGSDGAGGAGSVVISYTANPNPVPVANPTIADKCKLNYSIMMDASNSVRAAGAVDTMRTAVGGLMLDLVNTGSTVRLDQFGTAVDSLAPRTTVTAAAVTSGGTLSQGVEKYFDPQPPLPGQGWRYGSGAWQDPANWVQPPSPSRGWTNWDAGLKRMGDPADLPEVAVFLTDGDPTAFDLDRAGDPHGGAGSRNIGFSTDRDDAKQETINRAVTAANRLKSQGVRVLVIGVGSAFTNAESQSRLAAVSGPQILTDAQLSRVTSLNQVDVALAEDFATLDALMKGIVDASCGNTGPDPAPQPVVVDTCPLDYSLMLDASNSIRAEGAVETVRGAATSFLNGLNGTKSEARVAQFGTAAEELSPMVAVDAESLSSTGTLTRAVERYFTPQPPLPGQGWRYGSGDWANPANWVQPPSPSRGWTNWEDGLADLNKNPLPDVAVFVTDGDPTGFNLNRAGDPHGGAGSKNIGFATDKDSAKQETIARAIVQANKLKNKGVKVVVVGVGPAFTSAESQYRLMQISGPRLVDDASFDSVESVNDLDVAVVNDFDRLGRLLGQFASLTCGPVTKIEVTSNPDPSIPLGGTTTLVNGVSTDGKIQSVTPICQVNGQKWNNGKGPNSPGCHVDQGNHKSETNNRFLSSAAAKKMKKKPIRVTARPTCNRNLTLGVKIRSKADGQRAVVWQQTWKVKGNQVRCPVRAKG